MVAWPGSLRHLLHQTDGVRRSDDVVLEKVMVVGDGVTSEVGCGGCPPCVAHHKVLTNPPENVGVAHWESDVCDDCWECAMDGKD